MSGEGIPKPLVVKIFEKATEFAKETNRVYIAESLEKFLIEVDNLPNVKIKLQERIDQLNRADAIFCESRWDMRIHELERLAAREGSNQVTFARQELEEILKSI